MYWGATYVRYVYGYKDGVPTCVSLLLSTSEFAVWKLNNLDADYDKITRKTHRVDEIYPELTRLIDRVQLANDDN